MGVDKRDVPGDHGRGHLPSHPPSYVRKRLVEDDDQAAHEGRKYRTGGKTSGFLDDSLEIAVKTQDAHTLPPSNSKASNLFCS